MSTATTVPGYTVTGVAGIGGDGAVLRGHDAAGREVALRIVPEAPVGLLRRARVAGAVRHAGVAPLLEVVHLPGGGIAVVQELVPGPTLATLRAARRGLSAAECAQVATELLTALETLHAAGIVHGDVAPANVIVAPEEEETGRLVLVDLVGGAGAERGTRGFRAPELDQGAPASAAADVYSAAQVSLWVAEPAARREVAELLAPLLSADPAQRPSAHRGVQLLDGVARVGVGLAPAEVLASATLREHAARELTTRARVRRPRVRRRHRARGRRWLVRAGAAAGAVLVGIGGLALLDPGPPAGERTATEAGKVAWWDAPGGGGAATGSGAPGSTPGPARLPGAGSTDVAGAVRELLAARDTALSTADPDALAALTVPGSALATADAELLAELTGAGVHLTGYQTRIVDLEVLQEGGRQALVRLRLRQAEHQRTGPDGTRTHVPAQPVQCLELGLQREEGTATWRAATASPC